MASTTKVRFNKSSLIRRVGVSRSSCGVALVSVRSVPFRPYHPFSPPNVPPSHFVLLPLCDNKLPEHSFLVLASIYDKRTRDLSSPLIPAWSLPLGTKFGPCWRTPWFREIFFTEFSFPALKVVSSSLMSSGESFSPSQPLFINSTQGDDIISPFRGFSPSSLSSIFQNSALSFFFIDSSFYFSSCHRQCYSSRHFSFSLFSTAVIETTPPPRALMEVNSFEHSAPFSWHGLKRPSSGPTQPAISHTITSFNSPPRPKDFCASILPPSAMDSLGYLPGYRHLLFPWWSVLRRGRLDNWLCTFLRTRFPGDV